MDIQIVYSFFLMAKSEFRFKARELRTQGVSVKTIAKTLCVSRSSVSIWVRDIVLTREQIEALKQASIKGSEIGRFKSAQMSRKRRLDFIEVNKQAGKERMKQLTENELLLAGLALYWGEGSKKNGQLQFCNSDPNMIKFILIWLNKCFLIPRDQITCWIGINEIHKSREVVVKEYWSKVTGLPLTQFRNTSYKKVLNKKQYDNFEDHFGTLFLRVQKSSRLYYHILGMIDGLIHLPG